MPKKFTLDFVLKEFQSRGYKPLFFEYKSSSQKLPFLCEQGHKGEISFEKFRAGQGCKICGIRKRASRSRLPLNLVKSEFEKAGLTPLFHSYTCNTDLLKFKCQNGHVHQISLRDLKSGKRCGKCAKNRQLSLEDAKERFTKIGYTPLFDKYTNSHDRLPFRCKNGHLYKLSVSSIKQGSRCYFCRLDNRKSSIEEVKLEFISIGYTPLFEEYESTSDKLLFICDIGHKNTIRLNSLRNGHRCSICAREDRRTGISFVRQEFKEAGYEPLFDEYKHQQKPLKYLCENNHESEIRLHNLRRGQRCKKCFSLGVSKAEKDILNSLSGVDCDIVENSRNIIPPYELDLFFPEKNLAVEYCGLYWHSEVSGGKPRNYHYIKRKFCEDKHIRLITIFEDEYLEKPGVVLSRIKNALGTVDVKLYARKCNIKLIDNKLCNVFLNANHLQGPSRHKICFGLFYQDNLVGVMSGGSLSRRHVSHKKVLELKRLCFLPGYSIVGGSSKMFKHLKMYAIDNGFSVIRSYQDMRYGNPFNPVYENLGFKLVSETKYTPHYVGAGHSFRIRNQTLRKTPEERKTGKTEWELRREQGYDRIWDCGHRTYDFVI